MSRTPRERKALRCNLHAAYFTRTKKQGCSIFGEDARRDLLWACHAIHVMRERNLGATLIFWREQGSEEGKTCFCVRLSPAVDDSLSHNREV